MTIFDSILLFAALYSSFGAGVCAGVAIYNEEVDWSRGDQGRVSYAVSILLIYVAVIITWPYLIYTTLKKGR